MHSKVNSEQADGAPSGDRVAIRALIRNVAPVTEQSEWESDGLSVMLKEFETRRLTAIDANVRSRRRHLVPPPYWPSCTFPRVACN